MKKSICNKAELTDLLSDIFKHSLLKKLIFTKSKDKGITKTTCRLFLSTDKTTVMAQFETLLKDNKVLHKNLDLTHAVSHSIELITTNFKQAHLLTSEAEYQIIGKDDGFVMLKTSVKSKPQSITQHNQNKNYFFPNHQKHDFLIGLGIMTADGAVKHSQFDKFRQINKFLEYVENLTQGFSKEKPIKVVDLCCGKGYLTFAVYLYLTQCGFTVSVTGVDLKPDVVESCNTLARSLSYQNLEFICMDINDYDIKGCDIAISLHACNTATDTVLYKAITGGVIGILSSPCCHNELSLQFKSDELEFITGYPIFHQRFCAMLTDSLRANILKAYGYYVNVTEFIDLEGTAKNILITAVYNKTSSRLDTTNLDDIKEICNRYNLSPILLKLLNSSN